MSTLMLALVSASGGAATARRTILDCRTSAGRVMVTAEAKLVSYRFLGRSGADARIDAPVRSGRARRFVDRYASLHEQVRFVAGPWSYTVHSMDADPSRGSEATSGVLVRHGRRLVSDLPCRPHATWRHDPVLDLLPEDDEEWSAMSAG